MVTTRSRARDDPATAAAWAAASHAIDRGGNHALRRLLGVRGRSARPPCAEQEAEIRRLRRVVDQLKRGRAVTRARAARRAPDARGVDVFERAPFLMGGQAYQHPEVLWGQAQVSNARNRELARSRARRRLEEARLEAARAARPRVRAGSPDSNGSVTSVVRV